MPRGDFAGTTGFNTSLLGINSVDVHVERNAMNGKISDGSSAVLILYLYTSVFARQFDHLLPQIATFPTVDFLFI